MAVGLDLTHRMLQLARSRQAGAPRRAKRAKEMLVTGDMLALPFGESRFEVVTTGYGLRNVPDLTLAIHEIHRVLAPGGRFLSLDFNRPANPLVRSAYLTYLSVVGAALGFVLHGDPNTYRYIPESIRQYPGATGVARLIEAAGFTDVRVVALLGGLMAIHVARKPGLSSLPFQPRLERVEEKRQHVFLGQLFRRGARLDRPLLDLTARAPRRN